MDTTQRPDEVESRTTFGHWEADTIIGAHHQGALVTVIERKTRMLVCGAVNRRTKKAVANVIIEAMKDISQGVQSITFDNGGEFADHERIAQQRDCKTYFARTYERGSSENVNGQLRWYYPKGESLRDVEPFFSRSTLNISTAFRAGFSISSHHRACSTKNSLPSRSPIPARRHLQPKMDATSRFVGPCASITLRPRRSDHHQVNSSLPKLY